MRTVIPRTPDLEPNLLHEAILEQHPDWRGTPDPSGWRNPLVSLQSTDSEIRIDHPDADLFAVVESVRGRKRPPSRWRVHLDAFETADANARWKILKDVLEHLDGSGPRQ